MSAARHIRRHRDSESLTAARAGGSARAVIGFGIKKSPRLAPPRLSLSMLHILFVYPLSPQPIPREPSEIPDCCVFQTRPPSPDRPPPRIRDGVAQGR